MNAEIKVAADSCYPANGKTSSGKTGNDLVMVLSSYKASSEVVSVHKLMLVASRG